MDLSYAKVGPSNKNMLKHEEKEEEKVAEYPDQSHMISNLKQINNKLNEYLTNGIKENGHLDVDINREQYNTLQENDDVNHNSAQNTDLEHGEIINSGDKVTLQPVDINKKDGVKAVLETKKHTIVKFEKPDKENIERDKKLENQSLIDNKETLIDIKENENHSMKNERELKQNGKGDLTDDKGPNKQTATGNLDSENIEMMTLTSDNMIYKAQNHLHGQAIYSNPNLPTFLQNSLEEALSKIVIGEKSQEKTIEFIDYKDERHLPDLTSLITKDLSEPYSVYTYRYFLHNWPNLSFLAYCGETCVGAIVCKLDQHHKDVWRGYIAMLVVHKDYRRFKIGSKLVQKAIRRMIENGCDEVVLETEVTNRAALNLYENLGFVRDKRLLRYYLNGVDAWRLKLWLQ